MEKLSLRKMKISVCRCDKIWMVERLKAKALLVSEVHASEGQLGKSVGCQHELWNWMHQRNAGFGESDVSSWSRTPSVPTVQLPLPV